MARAGGFGIVVLLAGLLGGSAAYGQTQPDAGSPPDAAAPPVPAKPGAAGSAPPAMPGAAARPAEPGQTVTGQTEADQAGPGPAGDAVVDAAYAAYQRGRFRTALDLALKRAESDNDPVAMTLAAEIYMQGYGVRQDVAAAMRWYEAAAKLGNADALFALAVRQMPAFDKSRPGDKKAAAELFRQAAEKGNAAAAYNLGLLYLEGEVVPREPSVAAEWFRRAADQDQADAIYALAILYRDGNGVPKDLGETARLLQRATLLGNVVATVEYAIAVFNGTGTIKNEEKAAELFRKAALAGNAIAQNRLARILSAGRGLPQDQVAAAAWHLAAKQQGLDDPMLDKMVEELDPEERAKAEATLRRWAGQGA